MLNNIFSAFALLFFSLNAYPQLENTGYPIVGEPCPEFALKDVNYYPKNQISLADLRGKFVILDFWAKSCVSCIASFPKLNSLQKQFKDNLEIILVGKDDDKKVGGIRSIYEKYRQKLNLDLPVAYDTVLFSPPFKMRAGVPWYIWIDKNGIVKAVTSGEALTNVENIRAFVEGRDFSYLDRSYKAVKKQESSYDRNKPLLVNNNGGSDTSFLFRSLLTNWKPGMSITGGADIDVFFKGDSLLTKGGLPKYEVICSTISSLLITAYTGKRILPEDFYYKPQLLNLEDSLIFKGDYGNGEGLYSYSLIVPKEKARKHYLMQLMQSDLKNYFGYVAKIEEKEMPCLILKVTNKRKFDELKSSINSDINNSYTRVDGIALYNVNILVAADVLKRKTSGGNGLLNIYNETGYTGNIDLKVDALMTDLAEVRKALQKLGMDIVKGTRKQKVLFINKY